LMVVNDGLPSVPSNGGGDTAREFGADMLCILVAGGRK
jgi:hypothetical protein